MNMNANVAQVLKACLNHDQIAAISEGYEHILSGKAPGTVQHILHEHQLIGVLVQDPDGVAELAIDPQYRNLGYGQAALANVPACWAHGNLPAAAHIAQKQHWSITRELLVMCLAGQQLAQLSQHALPQPYRITTMPDIPQPEIDAALLRVNQEAFGWHPEQGKWDQAGLDLTRSNPWYRPEDVLLLWEHDTLVGFHWLKRYGDAETFHQGEVYIVGLGNAARGKGLGAALLTAGITHLREQGATEIILYVERDNVPAVKLYTSMGFSIAEQHILYRASE
ncbi:mycothiol synthase [Corynebacterium sp. HS2168-gen11]|uniref:mycothiol synthase n=1 Tax=Corynebacterium sp. HS2168-gen11 TaxID=2974027 RepID=UPI00216B09FE|nr:mycothiol synthase [Corynebacterium sp. HS2168-gen11]MCS4536052.1 mycothiol synthase [Corynebacterium sp. HS2168-gen11]